jgi:hypothetical protein
MPNRYVVAKKETVVRPPCLPGHTHHYCLGESMNGMTEGTCIHCDLTTVFSPERWGEWNDRHSDADYARGGITRSLAAWRPLAEEWAH